MNKPGSSAAHAMRRRAEDLARDRLAQSPESLHSLSPEALQQLMHELQVHQIELEMQNEELRRVQHELEASHARYFDLYDLAPVGYLTVSENGLILQANLSAATMLGTSRSMVVKRPISGFIVKGQQDIYYGCRKKLVQSGQEQTCELQLLQSEGIELWVKLSISTAQAGTGEPVSRVILSDISERKILDQSLLETNLELEHARLVAEKANRAKSEFLSNMSHELRSPLNAILGFAQLIESGTPAPTPSQRSSLAQILSGGWYLLALINEILDLALVESGKLALTLEPVSLATKLLDCQAMVEPQAQRKDIHLGFPVFDQHCFVLADRTRLKQVIVNLLSNAIKYNRVGGRVDVTYRPTAVGRVRISVHDSGPGLPPGKLDQLFQPFNRLGQECGIEEGTGIGLVLCKRLVELMDGEIGADSSVGVGSEFWFELRLASAPLASASPDQAAPTQPAALESGSVRRTVLYVEDNQANMLLIEELVARRPNLRLIRADNGASGIALAGLHQPDVILMDINLPDISGMQALKVLQQDPATRHIPVLALSANAMPDDISDGLAAGFLRYLTKPIQIDEFMQVLDLALKTARQPPS